MIKNNNAYLIIISEFKEILNSNLFLLALFMPLIYIFSLYFTDTLMSYDTIMHDTFFNFSIIILSIFLFSNIICTINKSYESDYAILKSFGINDFEFIYAKLTPYIFFNFFQFLLLFFTKYILFNLEIDVTFIFLSFGIFIFCLANALFALVITIFFSKPFYILYFCIVPFKCMMCFTHINSPSSLEFINSLFALHYFLDFSYTAMFDSYNLAVQMLDILYICLICTVFATISILFNAQNTKKLMLKKYL